MPAYELHELTRRFGRIAALDHVSFAAREGEFIVVLGPTGAGKTTLLRVIAGLDRPDAGSVFESRSGSTVNVTALAPAARDVAMVFQNFSLYPRLSVYENLAFPLRPKWRRIASAEIDRRVTWAAGLLGITEKLGQMPAQLSGGQQQRVAIGRAIVREPRLFLFDEPLANLDAKLREQMTVEIHRLQRRLNVTMLYVTHDQTEAMSLADRVIVLDEGRILQTGTPDEIYRKPVSPRVARMFGSPPINLLNAEAARRLGIASPQRTIGIRPEHVRLKPNPTGAARSTLIERLGPMTVVRLDVNGIAVRAVIDPIMPVGLGQTFDIDVEERDVIGWNE
jgi:multiple sugar transport system ATP-binding protein